MGMRPNSSNYGWIVPGGGVPIGDPGHRNSFESGIAKSIQRARAHSGAPRFTEISMGKGKKKRPRKWEGLWVRGLFCNFNTPILRPRRAASSDPGHNR